MTTRLATPKLRLHPGAALALAAVLALTLACGGQRGGGVEEAVPPPPTTRTDDVVEVLHGVEVADPYRWLEDQEAPETREWIEAQNVYTDSILGDRPDRDELRQLVEPLVKTDHIDIPTVRGGRYFYSRRAADADLWVIYMRQGADGEEQVLIDPHPMSQDHSVSVDLLDVSGDGRLLAYAVRQGGVDEVEVRLFDVDARRDLPDRLPTARYWGTQLSPDGESLYYTHFGAEGPRFYRHAVGQPATADDTLLFGDGLGPEKLLFVNLSEDGRYLTAHVLYSAAADRSDVYLDDLATEGGFETVVEGVDASFLGGVAADQLIVHTTWQAPNGRVMAASLSEPGIEHWRELVPERDGAIIEGVTTAGGKLFVNYLEDVRSKVVAFALDGTEAGEIAFDTLGTVGSISGRWDSDEAFFQFSSFHVPNTIYRYDVASGERSVWARLEVPIDPEQFVVQQVWYTSADGTRVPMFLVHDRDLERDGDNPTLLTGYGGFTASLTPSFSPRAAAWVELGGIYAVANLRGGGEFGEAWHRAGMGENKQNTFDDFIAAAEWLIDNGYTRSEKLAVRGGSNGGLLVGAMLTQRPDLVEAVVCAYPLLDMVRYHQFLVAGFWVPEYGSSEDPEQFANLYQYSPYHRVVDGTDYPAVLFITGDGDTRVAPLHARKMAARVQAASASGEPVLLRYHTKAGHSGGMPVSEQIDNQVEAFSFLSWQLGMTGS